MDPNSFELLRQRYHGKRIILAGDTGSLAALPDIVGLGLPIFTVDAGLHLLAGMGLCADMLWLQDETMLTKHRYLVEPQLKPGMTICLPHSIEHLVHSEVVQVIGFNPLGQFGFSHDPRIGTFSGYDPIYGLLQLISWIGPKHLSVVGVDVGQSPGIMTQNLENTEAGDLANKILLQIIKGLSTVRAQGIDVQIHSGPEIAPLQKVGS